jgi:hypothetical protein
VGCDRPLAGGDGVETAMVGPPVRGRIATWHDICLTFTGTSPVD